MYKHAYFDLRLHDEAELSSVTGSRVVERSTLHEWPLSCVQKLTLADGRRLVYKAAGGPTLESEFYDRAQSYLLVDAQTIYHQSGYQCMLLEWLDPPRLEELQQSEEAWLQTAQELLSAIALISGEVPYFLNLCTDSGWDQFMIQILTPLESLHTAGELVQVSEEAIAVLRTRLVDESVHQARFLDCGLVHNDLSTDNVFVSSDGYRVIDWQRPIYGPRCLDMVSLLKSAGTDPSPHVEPGIVPLWHLVHIHWLAQCAVRWFKPGRKTYDRQIAGHIHDMEDN